MVKISLATVLFLTFTVQAQNVGKEAPLAELRSSQTFTSMHTTHPMQTDALWACETSYRSPRHLRRGYTCQVRALRTLGQQLRHAGYDKNLVAQALHGQHSH